jgi:fused signal recognition particle receptor
MVTRCIVMAAGDTFRAAAAEQLEHVGRSGAGCGRWCVAPKGADPSSVIFDAVAQGGPIHYLVRRRLGGHRRSAAHEEQPDGRAEEGAHESPAQGAGSVDEVLLVLDATTGQNGLIQAEAVRRGRRCDGGRADQARRVSEVAASCTRSGRNCGLPIKLVGLGETSGRPRWSSMPTIVRRGALRSGCLSAPHAGAVPGRPSVRRRPVSSAVAARLAHPRRPRIAAS